jgi:hypothetical protein
VALDKAGTMFFTWLTRGRDGNACAVMSSKIPEQQQLNFSSFRMKEENCTCSSAFSSTYIPEKVKKKKNQFS